MQIFFYYFSMQILAKINLGKNMLRQEQHFFALKNLYLLTKKAIIAHVIDGRMP